jgi:hypothetical protein
MILGKSQKIAVRLYLQPQWAASPGSPVPLWSGVGVGRTGPRGMSGDVQGATLPQTEALTPLRHAARALEDKITR